MFEKEKCFDGEVPIERYVQSVPDKLIKLIGMILERDDFSGSLSKSLHKISTNIVQLICFNSLKRKRSEKIKKFLHSTKNESSLLVLVGLKVHAKTVKSNLVDTLADEGMGITYKRVLGIC